MITQIRGKLREVGPESIRIDVDPCFEFEVYVPEVVRRQLQSKVEEQVVLRTILYFEGNQMTSRSTPRLVGFLSEIDREFFEIFCSVDGVGVRKALRAMVIPVRDLARMIQDQDLKMLATFPGIGEATAERIVAKLRRKVSKYALIVGSTVASPKGSDGGAYISASAGDIAEPDILRDAFDALVSVGHSESQARQLIDQEIAKKKKYKTVDALLMAIYQNAS